MRALEQVLPCGGRVQAAQDVHGRGLAGPAGAHDGDELASRDVQRDALERQCAQVLYDQWANSGDDNDDDSDDDSDDWMERMFGTADDDSDTAMHVCLAVSGDPNGPAIFTTDNLDEEQIALCDAVRWDVVRDLCADKIGCEDRAAAFGGTPCQGWCHCLHNDDDSDDDSDNDSDCDDPSD